MLENPNVMLLKIQHNNRLDNSVTVPLSSEITRHYDEICLLIMTYANVMLLQIQHNNRQQNPNVMLLQIQHNNRLYNSVTVPLSSEITRHYDEICLLIMTYARPNHHATTPITVTFDDNILVQPLPSSPPSLNPAISK